MKQTQVYKVDLIKIDGSGDFACPRCGTVISPDDCTEEIYSILEAKVNNKGLSELVIRCNSCSSFLHLTGFSLLQELFEKAGDKLEFNPKAKKRPTSINHVR